MDVRGFLAFYAMWRHLRGLGNEKSVKNPAADEKGSQFNHEAANARKWFTR
ncbi:hypothetical protein [Peribacillus sp. SCS-155]|uniref:hypothetical protein n=1 Tax=Peribacillus sedimenti TaxID=3115297 RepID=UPI003905B716